MRFTQLVAGVLLAAAAHTAAAPELVRKTSKIAPKVLIISMFAPEASVWYTNMPKSGLGDLLAVNVSAPGLSMLFPHIHCLKDHSVCQMTTGESEINAASSVMAAALSDKLDLRKTYFLIAGIAGINPKQGTLGSVALARYAVQVALQYEFDAREMPANFTTGYLPYGVDSPDAYPKNTYGTEVFELNAALRDLAYGYAAKANLSDNAIAAEYRARYAAAGEVYVSATRPPSVAKCDSATSDVYYSGKLLSEAFENTTTIWTNGTGVYCMTAQEDNATLEVLVRMAIEGRVDYSRAILMRTGSDFDRPPPGVSAFDNLRKVDQNGFPIAISNIYSAGIEIVKGILTNWDHTFKHGVAAENYVGDIFGSLGGKPDFGLGSITGDNPVLPDGETGDLKKRGVSRA